MDIKAVICDLDGVICSTDECHYRAWKSLTDDLNIYFDKQINNQLRGIGRMESLEIILKQSDKAYTLAEKEIWAARKNSIYQQELNSITQFNILPTVCPTLDTLRKMGKKLAIGSSSRNALLILERLGLADYFDVVVDGNMITRSKPDPEVFLLAANLLCVKPSHCIVVEDALAGLLAALSGGFNVAGIGEASKDSRANWSLSLFEQILRCV